MPARLPPATGLYTDNYAAYGSRMFYHVWDIPIFCCIGGWEPRAGGLSAVQRGGQGTARCTECCTPQRSAQHRITAHSAIPLLLLLDADGASLAACAGALGGLLGALFIHLNVRITQFRHRHIPFR